MLLRHDMSFSERIQLCQRLCVWQKFTCVTFVEVDQAVKDIHFCLMQPGAPKIYIMTISLISRTDVPQDETLVLYFASCPAASAIALALASPKLLFSPCFPFYTTIAWLATTVIPLNETVV